MDQTVGDREFETLRKLIYKITGISLNQNKQNLLTSRLTRRLRALKLSSFREYCIFLAQVGDKHPEIQELINCVTTNKTDFFRESHHFDFVRSHVIPECRAAKKMRIWHAGCSSGEEAYTLAITLRDAIPDFDTWQIQHLASDIDTKILADAASGVYDEGRLEPVPTLMKRQFFLRGKGNMEGKVAVRKDIRDSIDFLQINLLDQQWGVTGPFDLIMCRNVMIYFDKPTQAVLIEKFNKLLRPGGYLMVGHSESLSGIEAGLDNLGKTIYRKPGGALSSSSLIKRAA